MSIFPGIPANTGFTRETLVIKEYPFALASYLESISEESRAIFFKIIKDNKESVWL